MNTRLPHVLAMLYGFAIVYASLEPFSPWLPPPPGTPFFLFAPPSRWVRGDIVLNVVAYVPFGLFVALLHRGASPARAWSSIAPADACFSRGISAISASACCSSGSSRR